VVPRNFASAAEFFKSKGPRRTFHSMTLMLTLLELIAVLSLVAISLAGFVAAVLWSFAIWFGGRG
jgi:hypothetical protein